MRLALLADIHANLPALEAVLTDARQHNAEAFIVAGDHITGGPHPNETMHALRALACCWMIRGNTDDYLVDYAAGTVPESWRTASQWALARWSYRQTDQDALAFLAALPTQRVVALPGTAPIRVVHGTPSSPVEHLFPDPDSATMAVFRQALLVPLNHVPFDAAIAQVEEPVLVCGHSHISWKHERDRRLVVNPGSVGAPINGDPRAQYALLTWQNGHWRAEHRAIPYDLARERAAYIESGLLAEGGGMARAFLRNVETGRNVARGLLSHAYALAAQAGVEDCEIVPDEIWERAVATFDWKAAGTR